MAAPVSDLAAFRDFHLPALEQNEARHNLILALLGTVGTGAHFSAWTLGAPGQCAVMSPGRSIVLADLDRSQCRKLAEATADVAPPGVVGPDSTARWFAERAAELGAAFLEPVP